HRRLVENPSRARLEAAAVLEGRSAADGRLVRAKPRTLVAPTVHAPDPDRHRIGQDRLSLIGRPRHRPLPHLPETQRIGLAPNRRSFPLVGLSIHHWPIARLTDPERLGLAPILHPAPAGQWTITERETALDGPAKKNPCHGQVDPKQAWGDSA